MAPIPACIRVSGLAQRFDVRFYVIFVERGTGVRTPLGVLDPARAGILEREGHPSTGGDSHFGVPTISHPKTLTDPQLRVE
jgi:hypothetical protein